MEVLHALGEDQFCDYLNNIAPTDQISPFIHQKLLDKLRQYFILGGIPHVVSLYVAQGNLLLCREAQTGLLNRYRSDFGK